MGTSGATMDYRLPTAVVPTRYDIRLVPDLGAATFVGEETIAVTVREPVTEIELNAAELSIESVVVRSAGRARPAGAASPEEIARPEGAGEDRPDGAGES